MDPKLHPKEIKTMCEQYTLVEGRSYMNKEELCLEILARFN